MYHYHISAQKTNRILDKIDPRVRLSGVVGTILFVINQNGFLFPTLIFLFYSALIITLGVRIRTYLRRLAEPCIIGIMLIFVKSFSGAIPICSWAIGFGNIVLFQDGISAGCAIAFRVIASVSALLLLVFSCSLNELLSALSWFRIPRVLIEILLFACRSLTSIYEEASTIYHAQMNRLGYVSVRQGIRSFGILAGMLTLRAFDQSRTTALAMTQRGYMGHLPLTNSQKLKQCDYLVIILYTILLTVLWIKTSDI
jgi:cobalt/nickel transport system permease protein